MPSWRPAPVVLRLLPQVAVAGVVPENALQAVLEGFDMQAIGARALRLRQGLALCSRKATTSGRCRESIGGMDDHHQPNCTTHREVVDPSKEMAVGGSNSPRLASVVDNLQSSGRYCFTGPDLIASQASEVAFDAAARRLKKQRRIASPSRGFFVIVPVEFREAGCPPASWFIADLMRFPEQPYYVGLLSAAAPHGASHQQPMAFRVITNRPTRTAQVGRVRIEFHVSRSVEEAPAFDVQTDTGAMRESTPEVTACDLLRFPAAVGYLNNIATVLGDLRQNMGADTLAGLAPT